MSYDLDAVVQRRKAAENKIEVMENAVQQAPYKVIERNQPLPKASPRIIEGDDDEDDDDLMPRRPSMGGGKQPPPHAQNQDKKKVQDMKREVEERLGKMGLGYAGGREGISPAKEKDRFGGFPGIRDVAKRDEDSFSIGDFFKSIQGGRAGQVKVRSLLREGFGFTIGMLLLFFGAYSFSLSIVGWGIVGLPKGGETMFALLLSAPLWFGAFLVVYLAISYFEIDYFPSFKLASQSPLLFAFSLLICCIDFGGIYAGVKLIFASGWKGNILWWNVSISKNGFDNWLLSTIITLLVAFGAEYLVRRFGKGVMRALGFRV